MSVDVGGGVVVRGVFFGFFFSERFRFLSVGAGFFLASDEGEETLEGVGSAALEVSMERSQLTSRCEL